MAAVAKKRTAGAQGAAHISEVTVHSDTNAGAGWVYKVLKNEDLYTSLAGAEQTAADDAIVAATMDAMTEEA